MLTKRGFRTGGLRTRGHLRENSPGGSRVWLADREGTGPGVQRPVGIGGLHKEEGSFVAQETSLVSGIAGRYATALFDMARDRSEEHTSELQSLMRISYAVFCLKKKKTQINNTARSR